MVDCYAGEIRMFSGSWAPEGWVLCQGQLLQINQYQVLYALLSTTYGGDGVNTFAVPDLRSRIPLGFSSSTPPSPLSTYSLGATGGEEQVTLTTANLPVHSHAMLASNAASAGLTPYSLGEVIGQTTAQATLPNHTHQMSGGVAINGGSDTLHPAPTSNSLVSATYGQFNYAEATSQSQLTGLATTLLTQTGNSQAHANISPYLPVQFCICWEGVYPINPN